jgi:RecB family exonuclease
VKITGRIDRVDRHPSGEWTIFDYKTGESGDPPDKTHLYKDDWIDLQLPLYRRLAGALKIGGSVRLGYILLPKSPTGARAEFADWSDEQLAGADQRIREIAEHILNGEFWPPSPEPPRFDDFAPICMEGVFGRKVLE